MAASGSHLFDSVLGADGVRITSPLETRAFWLWETSVTAALPAKEGMAMKLDLTGLKKIYKILVQSPFSFTLCFVKQKLIYRLHFSSYILASADIYW